MLGDSQGPTKIGLKSGTAVDGDIRFAGETSRSKIYEEKKQNKKTGEVIDSVGICIFSISGCYCAFSLLCVLMESQHAKIK